MRGTMARRILSCVLLVSMLLSLVPSVAFTQEGSTPVPEHTHNEAGWKCTMEKVLTCENEDEDHVHDEEDCYTEVWTCQAPSDLVQLTVEYFATVDGKSLRVAETYEAVLRNGSAYSVTLPDLSEKGYTVDLDNIYIQNADGSTTMITLPMDGAISGELVEDLHYVVNYSYTELNAPYADTLRRVVCLRRRYTNYRIRTLYEGQYAVLLCGDGNIKRQQTHPRI